MRQDLLKLIAAERDVTSIIILTHNIDFVFLQLVVLQAVRQCGHPSMTILADAGCAEDSYARQHEYLDGLGRRYRVIPVTMNHGFRFHPKAILLSGPKKATLFVGSGNLTFGGMRNNAEIWVRYDSDVDGTGEFSSFKQYVEQLAGRTPIPDIVLRQLAEAFDPSTRNWASELETPQGLLNRSGKEGESSMMEQLTSHFSESMAEHLHVCAPYFDEDAEAIQMLGSAVENPGTTLYVQSNKTTLTVDGAAKLDESVTKKSIEYIRVGENASNDKSVQNNTFVHAKFYGIEGKDGVAVAVGSANCSRAALTIPGARGNAELMAHRQISKEKFQLEFLDELSILGDEPQLMEAPPIAEQQSAEEDLFRICSASWQQGKLSVTFQSDEGVKITSVRTDAGQVFEGGIDSGLSAIVFDIPDSPRSIILIGESRSGQVRSKPHWVDDERQLRESARTRSLVDAIDRNMRAETWGISAYHALLRAMVNDMDYTTSSGVFERCQSGESSGLKEKNLKYEWEDVFSDEYDVQAGEGVKFNAFESERTGIDFLNAFVSRWFGLGVNNSEGETDGDWEKVESFSSDDNGDMNVDRQVNISTVSDAKTLSSVSLKDRKRVLRLWEELEKCLSNPEFIQSRSASKLVTDFLIVSILLPQSYAEKWVSEDEFAMHTLKIWVPLFLNPTQDRLQELTERMYSDELDFDARVADLAAALAAWALSMPKGSVSTECALAELCCCLGIARLPRLWQAGGNKHIITRAAEILANWNLGQELDRKDLMTRWMTLVRQGKALQSLEHCLKRTDITLLRSGLNWTNAAAGELFWQGSIGYCVCGQGFQNNPRSNFTLYSLTADSSGTTEKRFRGEFLIPLSAVIESDLGALADISSNERAYLQQMIESLRDRFAELGK